MTWRSQSDDPADGRCGPPKPSTLLPRLGASERALFVSSRNMGRTRKLEIARKKDRDIDMFVKRNKGRANIIARSLVLSFAV